MSYKITEAERKHIATIEDMEIKLISWRSPVDNVPEYFISFEDPTETNEGIKAKLESFKIALPKYDFLVTEEDDAAGRINLINKNTSNLVISTDGFEHKGIGWRYKLEAFNSKEGSDLVTTENDYLYRLEMTRENDGQKFVIDLTRLGDITVKTLTVDGEIVANSPATFNSSVTIAETGALNANGPIDINGVATFDGQSTFNGATTFTSTPTFDEGALVIGNATFQKDETLGDDVEQKINFVGVDVVVEETAKLHINTTEPAIIEKAQIKDLTITGDGADNGIGLNVTHATIRSSDLENTQIDHAVIEIGDINNQLNITENATLNSTGNVILEKADIKTLNMKLTRNEDGDIAEGQDGITYQANIENIDAENIVAKNATFENITTLETANLNLKAIKSDSIVAMTADENDESGTLLKVIDSEPSPDAAEEDKFAQLPKGTVVIGSPNTKLVFNTGTSMYGHVTSTNSVLTNEHERIPVIAQSSDGEQRVEHLAFLSDVEAIMGTSGNGPTGVVKLTTDQEIDGKKTFMDPAVFGDGIKFIKNVGTDGTAEEGHFASVIVKKHSEDENKDGIAEEVERKYVQFGDSTMPLMLTAGAEAGEDVHICTSIHVDGIDLFNNGQIVAVDPDNPVPITNSPVDEYKIPFVRDVIHKNIAKDTEDKIVGKSGAKVVDEALEFTSKRLNIVTGYSNLNIGATEDEWNTEVAGRVPPAATEESFVKFTSKTLQFKEGVAGADGVPVIEMDLKGLSADADGNGLVTWSNSKSSGVAGGNDVDNDNYAAFKFNLPVDGANDNMTKDAVVLHGGNCISINGLPTTAEPGKDYEHQFEVALDVTGSQDFRLTNDGKLELKNLVDDHMTVNNKNLTKDDFEQLMSQGSLPNRTVMTAEMTRAYVEGKIKEVNGDNSQSVLPATPTTIGTYNLIASVEANKTNYHWGSAGIPADDCFENPADVNAECNLVQFFENSTADDKYVEDFYKRSFGLKMEVVPVGDLLTALTALKAKAAGFTSGDKYDAMSETEIKAEIDRLAKIKTNFKQSVVWTEII